ncbi:MAG: response regulator [Actinomycetota bacterium]
MAKILVVDDDAATAELVAAQLRRSDHRVQTAGSASDALKLLSGGGSPDVAVLDIGLPDMDGRDLLVALRELPGLDKLPGIFLSGHVEQEEVEAGRALGARYLTKPYVRSALLEAIRLALLEAASREDANQPGAGW